MKNIKPPIFWTIIGISIGYTLYVIATNAVKQSYTSTQVEINTLENSQGPFAGLTSIVLDTMLNTTETSLAKTEVTEVAEPEIEVIIEDAPSYTQEDLTRLARIIYFEAGSFEISSTCKYYVGSVVLNRVASEDYADTIKEVIAAPGQYAPADYYMTASVNEEAFKTCKTIAEDLLKNGSVLPEYVVYQANFIQGNHIYEYIDGIYFCY